MSQPDLTTTKFILRCMGGDKCNHAAGTCTATQTPEDWVLIEAAKRGGFNPDLRSLRSMYAGDGLWKATYRALCDMIAKHEQKPVDRKLLCAREAMRFDMGTTDICVRAIELWEEGFGK